ncbi:MAG: hypothetical protein RLZZ293_60, partial [Pseudomonadota bacterium]
MKNKAYKYRIYPTAEQKQLLAQIFGCVRVISNNLLDWRNKEYSLNRNKINYTKSSAHLTELKNQEQFSWLNDVSSVALQQTLRSQDATFSNFFAKRAKYPRVLNIVAIGDDLSQARQLAYQQLKQIEFAGCYYRCDIGV